MKTDEEQHDDEMSELKLKIAEAGDQIARANKRFAKRMPSTCRKEQGDCRAETELATELATGFNLLWQQAVERAALW